MVGDREEAMSEEEGCGISREDSVKEDGQVSLKPGYNKPPGARKTYVCDRKWIPILVSIMFLP